MYSIENDILKVEINSKGAELQSIYNKQTQIEYLWCGDEKFWGKKSPVLFPIVGGLKNNEYSFNNDTYNLTRHGFARDSEFTVQPINATTIQFVLQSSIATLAKYPFVFEFIVEYSIAANQLTCTYIVKNTDTQTLYFSVGAHPAFALPLTTNTNFEDWYLQFEKNENCGIYPLTKGGLLLNEPQPFFNNTSILALNKNLFYNDALVFKQLQSTYISIKSKSTIHGVKMSFEGFPYFGIWSAKDANFICLEPWLGIADCENSIGNLKTKEGIIELNAQQTFTASYGLELF